MKFNPDEQVNFPYEWSEAYNIIKTERARQHDKHGGMQHDLAHDSWEWREFITSRFQWLLNRCYNRYNEQDLQPDEELSQNIERELLTELAALGFALADQTDELKTRMRVNGL